MTVGILLGDATSIEKFMLLFDHYDPGITKIITKEHCSILFDTVFSLSSQVIPLLAIGSPPHLVSEKWILTYVESLQSVKQNALDITLDFIFGAR